MDIGIVKQPILETKRLSLRPLRLSDTGLIDLYVSDFRVAGMTASISHPNPPGATQAFIERVMAPEYAEETWAIDATKGFGVEVLGVITLRPDGELGYWIGPFFWGLGIATEAARAVTDYGFSKGHDRIWAQCFADNPASAGVLKKLGMAQMGEGGSGYCVARGENVEQVMFERVRSDG